MKKAYISDNDCANSSSVKVRVKVNVIVFLLCIIQFSAPAMAAPLLFHLWSEEQPAPTPSPFLSWTDEQPNQTDGVHSWRVTDPTLTIYLPEQSCGQAILCCPGGGYWDVWHGTEGHNLAQWLNEQGIALAVLTYRLPAGVKDIPLEDVQRAMRLMREHQSEWGIQEIGIMGFSAGGHLAATAATRWSIPEERPDFQILFYPVITMDESFTHMGSRINLLGDHPSQQDILLYSCEKQVTKQTPRALIVASSDDGLVPVQNSISYYRALLDHDISATLILYPEGGHGWCSHLHFRYRQQWMDELEHWLRTTR